jgi:serine/threonine protein kinase
VPTTEAPVNQPILLYLAAEGVVPVLAGCAGVAAAGPAGGMAGVAVGLAVERAINLFGRGIVARWRDWFAAHPGEAAAAVAALAAVPPADARAAAKSIVLDLAPDAAAEDVSLAVEFLTAIPHAVDRALVPAPDGGRSVPATVLWDDARSLLQLLPEDVPPYPADTALAGTPYRLRELLGAGGFGAVYRAESPSLQHLPLAIKFCLDRSLLPALNQERSNLERLMRAAGPGAAHVVRLYGYDLDHATPYIVYEFVPGGDLTRFLAARVTVLGRAPGATEVFGWVVQIAEGLAFAHAAGLVHRDLKPANVLAAGPPAAPTLKLADFGLGGVAAARAAVRSRIGSGTLDYLSLADQASLFRGAGTPLYMSPEQRRGAAPDPRHDLNALGVMWFQLLVGDVSRELPHGWAKELTVRYGVPATHVALIERCVGWMDERPKDATELLALLKANPASPDAAPADTPLPPPPAPAAPTISDASQETAVPVAASSGRRIGLTAALGAIDRAHADVAAMATWTPAVSARWALLFGGLAWIIVFAFFGGPKSEYGPIVASVIGVFVGALYFAITRYSVQATIDDNQLKVEERVAEMTADFATEVADWGGRAALRDPETVRRLLAELNPPPPSPAPPNSRLSVADIAADPTGKALLMARLTELQQLRKDTKEGREASWFGQALLWLFLVPTLAGGGFGLVVETFRAPTAVGVLAAVVVGLAVFWVIWSGMARVRRGQAAKWSRTADRFVADYPRVVEGWGGRPMLESEQSVAAVMRLIDPEAGAAKRGWFRRLFGG